MKYPRGVAPVVIVIAGAAVFYLLGRWEAAVDAELAELRSETAAVIGLIQARRAWSDSVKALEDSLQQVDAALEKQEGATREAIRHLEAADSAAAAFVETAPLEDLLPLLQMRPLEIGDTTWYAATPERARVLAEGVLRLPLLQAQNDSLRSLVNTQQTRITTITVGWKTTLGRADSLQAALDRAEPILEAWQQHSNCRVLGIVSCPSRTTSFVVGATVSTLGHLVLGGMRQ